MATTELATAPLPAETLLAETKAETKAPHPDEAWIPLAVPRSHAGLRPEEWPPGFYARIAELVLAGLVAGLKYYKDGLGHGLLQAVVVPEHLPLNTAGHVLATNPAKPFAEDGQRWWALVPDPDAGCNGCKAKRVTVPPGTLKRLTAELATDVATGLQRVYLEPSGPLYGDLKLPEWLALHDGLKNQRPLLEAQFGDLSKLQCLDLRPPRKSSPKKEAKKDKAEKRDASPSRGDKEKKKSKTVSKDKLKELKKKLKALKPEAQEAKKNLHMAEKLLAEAKSELKAKAAPYQAAKLKYLEAKLHRHSSN